MRSGLPEFTAFESKKVFGVLRVSYVPGLRSYFIGSWEVDFLVPCIVSGLAFSTLILLLIEVVPWYTHRGIISLFMILLFVLFLYSYFRVIFEGPGYFPFYEFMISSGVIESKSDDSISGIVSTREQHQWMREHPAPPRSIFSSSARRFILRPDHECCYTSSWIGKRNMKFFILFNFYGFIYLMSYSFICGYYGSRFLVSKEHPIRFLIFCFVTLLAVNFGSLTGYYVFVSIRNALKGVTTWELEHEMMRGIVLDVWSFRNLEDICGSEWYLWCFPVSPWSGLSNEDISRHYERYPRVLI